ncbi:hypothetical protein [Palleronia abyssalis]|uniref:Type IV pilus biogenesis n=1 Tax=Palleronia abyssalis TaxID=1501240 RepID=A0A2R8BUU9_9RHOB|nr:hypothetical protein [Palleronia abyssalis]SPJ23947.1 hypothetical protein PAA8504_01768 [Palleronia abyssalis]
MTYDYALDFTPEGVRLLKGSGKDQIVMGEVALNDPHFETRLEDLRKEVEAETGEPVSPALLIPHSEILFHTMNLGDEDDAEREAKVRSELEGLTPYRIDDLVYDWKSISKTQVQVAAVARDTLDEADGFAAHNGFGPGPFTTHPKAGAFRGQPDFGASARPAPKPLVEPEPEPAPEPVAPPPALLDTKPAPVEAPPKADAPAVPPPSKTTEPAAKGTMPAKEASASQPKTGDASKSADGTSDKPTGTTPPGKSAGAAASKTGSDPEKTPESDPTRPALIDDYAEIGPTRQPLSPLDPVDPTARQARRGYVAPSRAKASEDAAAKAALAPGAASVDEGKAPASFSSRRQSDTATAAPMAPAGAPGLDSIAPRIQMLPDGGATPKVPPRPNGAGIAPDSAATQKAPPPLNAPGVTPQPRSGVKPGPGAPTPTVRKVEAPDAATDAARSLGGNTPGTIRSRNNLSEAEALTVFGMREPPRSRFAALLPVAIGLVVALLLALAVWSVFFFLVGPEEPVESASLPVQPVEEPAPADQAQPIAPEVTPDEIRPPGPESDSVDTALLAPAPETEPAPPADDVDIVVPEIEIVPDTSSSTASDEATAETEGATEQETDEATVEEETAEPLDPVEPALQPGPNDPLNRSPEAPEATRYAATGVSTEAPSGSAAPSVESLDSAPAELSDSTIRTLDSISAPSAPETAAFTRPAALIPPPPAGSRFELDANGRVLATPEGTVSPQGVRITAGRPAAVPPAAPGRTAAAPAEPAAETTPEATPETDAEPAAELPVDESNLTIPVTEGQPSATPPARPEEVTPEADDQAAALDQATSPQIEITPDIPVTEVSRATDPIPLARPGGLGGTSLAALADDEADPSSPAEVYLASFTPRARPQDLAPEVVEAAEAPEVPQLSEQETTAQAEAVAAAIASIIPETEEISPYAVGRSVRPDARPRNLANRVEQARPTQVAAAAATVTPRAPTAGSVASRATQSNAIRLNRVNLIGVYGTQSNRRALVRLPSGRFVKVKVGDRVDGGRVSAIGSDQLQYVKGGRSVTLAIPQG